MNICRKYFKDKESFINIGLHVEAFDEDGNGSEVKKMNVIDHMTRPQRKPYKRRSDSLNYHENVNVFYDEKTKKFTENCKLRRLKLSGKNGDSVSDILQPVISPVITTDHEVIAPPIIVDTETTNIQSQRITTQRYSQRERRSSYKKADYFYPDSIDSMLKEKNNNSQVSTPVQFDTIDDIVTNSPKLSHQYSFQNNYDQNSVHHSPTSVSLPATEFSPQSKQKLDSFPQSNGKDDGDVQILYKTNDDGKHQCLICTNKTFRKKQLVIDHLKHYHPMVNNEQCIAQTITQTVPKPAYISSNKRYYSSYLKANRTSIVRKRKYNKSKIKSLMKRNSWSRYSSRNTKSDNWPVTSFIGYNKARLNSFTGVPGPKERVNNTIVYCHRCKKCTESHHMVQCVVCLCWSHSVCYDLSERTDNDSFWECDGCANTGVVDGANNTNWYRDRCRFHSIPRNELPWSTKNSTAPNSQCNILSISEMMSFLSLCQKVLDAIKQQLNKLCFKNCIDTCSQDDLDILKNLCSYEHLDSLALTVDNDDMFHVTSTSTIDDGCNSSNMHCSSSNSISKSITNQTTNSSNYHSADITFSHSTSSTITEHNHNNNHKLSNSNFDGILDCELQKLDIIPTADFDALVKDLNLSDDICKSENHLNLSKSSILDIIDTADSMIELLNDDIANLLIDKLPQKTNANCDNTSIKDNQLENSLNSTYSSEFSTESVSKLVRSDIINQTTPIVPTTSQGTTPNIGIELPDWSTVIRHDTNYHLGSNIMMSSVESIEDLQLSTSDSNNLEWLLTKYRCVEKIIESIDESLASSVSSEQVAMNSAEEEYHQMSKYLHSLLYILSDN